MRWFEDYIDLLDNDLAVFRGVKEGRLDWAVFAAMRHLRAQPLTRGAGLIHFKRLEGTELLRLHDALVTVLQEYGLGKPEEISMEQIVDIPGEVFDMADGLLDEMAQEINELRKQGVASSW